MSNEPMTREQLMTELRRLQQENTELKLVLKNQNCSSAVSQLTLCDRHCDTSNLNSLGSFSCRSQQFNTIKYHLSELIDITLLEKLFHSYFVSTGISHSLFDSDNNILIREGWQDICTKFHRICPQTECRCRLSDTYIASHLDRPYIEYQCLNGLIDCAVPIVIEGQHLATIFSGQFLYEPPDEDLFRRRAQEFEFNEKAYIEALHKVPIIPKEQVATNKSFFLEMRHFIENIALERVHQLTESEDKFLKSFNCCPDPISITTYDTGHYLDVNDAWVKITGYEKSEVIGQSIIELGVYVNLEERIILLNEIQTEGCVRDFETSFRIKSGEIRTFLTSVEMISINKKTNLFCVYKDITERIKIVEQLKAAEEKFYKAFQYSPSIMALISTFDYKYININETFCRVLGYKRDEILENTLMGTNPHLLIIRQKLTDDKIIQNMEINFFTKTGEKRMGLLSAVLVNIDGQECMLEVVQDITELRQMEDEIARLDRFNLIGQIAASMGHEIRNPMTTVRGYLQMLRENKDYKQEIECFDLMIEELDRANSIITEFLGLAKNKMADLVWNNLNDIIKSLFPQIQAKAMSRDHHIKLDIHDLPDLLLDQNEIRQLILNLVDNGLESMTLPGIVTIGTYTEKDKVVLTVQDQGYGIDHELLDKLGTPFFTTKEQGTGLGLAICNSIAARHNATIDISTSPRGTIIFVRFLTVITEVS